MNGSAREETLRFGTLRAVAALGCFGGSLGIIFGVLANHAIAPLGILAGVGFFVGALGALAAIPLVGRGHQAPPTCQTPRSLRWLGYVLPRCEGDACVAEWHSLLAEEPDLVMRRRYRRGYWRGVPKLFAVCWAEHAVCRCRCREKQPRRRVSPGARPTDSPLWRLLFLLVEGRDGQWWRALLLAVAGLILVGALASVSRVDGSFMVALGALLLSRLWLMLRRR